MSRVFISSTVYDLLDVRAELESLLRNIGVTPVMSGSSTAEFELSNDANSIETCLANLRLCDSVILVLCQRYGPRLGRVGFDDISATHLEYREAAEKKIPIFVYVRDRLEADFAVWKRNKKSGDVRLTWIPSQHDRGILELLEEHRKLVAKMKRSNWLDTFQTISDLKQLVIRDLGPAARRAELETLIANDDIPAIDVSVEQTPEPYSTNIGYTITFRNIGRSTAYDLHFELGRELTPKIKDHPPLIHELPCLMPGQATAQSIVMHSDTEWNGTLKVEYNFPQGHIGRECYRIGGRRMTAGLIASGASLESRDFFVGAPGQRPFKIRDSDIA